MCVCVCVCVFGSVVENASTEQAVRKTEDGLLHNVLMY